MTFLVHFIALSPAQRQRRHRAGICPSVLLPNPRGQRTRATAGLLTMRPKAERLPDISILVSGYRVPLPITAAHSCGTVGDSHPIPFSSLRASEPIAVQSYELVRTMQNKTCFIFIVERK